EDLLLGDRGRVVDIGEDRRLNVVTAIEVARTSTTCGESGAFCLALCDVALNPITLTTRHEWSHLRRRIERIADADVREPAHEGVHQLVVPFTAHQEPRQ